MGQKNKRTRRRARRGTRPRAPHDQRTEGACLFGALCPARAKGDRRVMPWCDTHPMAEPLRLISQQVEAGAHALLILDRAGGQSSPKWAVPDNITLVPRPPGSPEVNPVENVWGRSSGTPGFRPSFSRSATTSQLTAAKPGTPSCINQGASSQSEGANGPIGWEH